MSSCEPASASPRNLVDLDFMITRIVLLIEKDNIFPSIRQYLDMRNANGPHEKYVTVTFDVLSIK